MMSTAITSTNITPLGLARKISKAFRLLGFKTTVGQYARIIKGRRADHWVRIYGSQQDVDDSHMGLVVIRDRDHFLTSDIEYDSDAEAIDAWRALTADLR